MNVINKNNNKSYEVFDITYDKAGYPHFLIYKDEQWVRLSAKHFKPYTFNDLGYAFSNFIFGSVDKNSNASA